MFRLPRPALRPALGHAQLRAIVLCLGAAMLSACASAPASAPAGEPVPPERPAAANTSAGETNAAAEAPAPTPAVTSTKAMDFQSWRAAFRARALAEGISPAVFDAAFDGVRVRADVLERDRFQPEFVRPIWQYLDSAVSTQRIDIGISRARSKAALLAEIEARHNVEAEVVVAVWGLESAYGANYGNTPVIAALATLAHDGRRRAFAEEQLIAALRIIQAGDIAPERMVGSWSGAMGHTQFIPTSFLDYAVDHDGDGRRDIWAPDAADALASTANYLAAFGWDYGAPAVHEVALPAGFDYASASSGPRAAADWRAVGVTLIDGRALPAGEAVEILLPAGAEGPAFATWPNFKVIRRYNNATSYALAIAMLARQIDGQPGIVASWPRDDRALTRDETREVQELLTTRGYDTRGIDGIIGPDTRRAVRAFQAARG
ncbi:MAG: lytic murein transglycosylase, partial [Pseudomonadota bacterium]